MGHGPHGRVVGDEAVRAGQVGNHSDLVERVLDAAADRDGRSDDVDGPDRAGRQYRPAGAVQRRPGTADEQAGTPAIVLLEHFESADGVGGRGHGHRVGDHAQRRGKRRLVAGVDRQQGGD